MIKLVPIDAVRASEYNPRRNDEKRLALTELSLRKLGFLLPIYADESGEILSGHQRHLVASRMGFRQIPVEYVSGKTLGERRAVNVLLPSSGFRQVDMFWRCLNFCGWIAVK